MINYINAYKYGVYCLDFYNSGLQVYKNKITNYSASAVMTNLTQPGNVQYLNILNNSTQNYTYTYNNIGIVVTNVQGPSSYPSDYLPANIFNNKIKLSTPGSASVTYAGIRATACNYIVINYNTVRAIAAKDSIADGISAVVCPGSQIGCDSLVSVKFGIRLWGYMPTMILKNKIITNRWGVKLDTAYIGRQGSRSPQKTYDNEWFNMSTKRVYGNVHPIYPDTIVWYYRSGTTFSLTSSQYSVSPNWAFKSVLRTIPTCPSCIQVPTVSMTMMAGVQSVAMNNTNSAADLNTVSDDYFTNLYIYNTIRNNPELLTGSLSLLQRYNLLNAGNLPIFASISQGIANSDFDNALLYNNNVSDRTLAEQNMKTANAIYLNTWAKGRFTFTDDEYSTLLSIARQSPLRGGPGVVTARVMLEEYLNSGNNMNQRIEAREIPPEPENISYFSKAYPNPSYNEFSIEYFLQTDSKAILYLYNISGQLMNSINIDTGNSKLNINTGNLSEGIYFYNIVVNGKIVEREKIILIK